MADEMAGDVLWTELATLARGDDENGLHSSDLVDLALVCSVAWRTWPGRADVTADFLESWAAPDKAAYADGLEGLATVPRMISALREQDATAGRPPFGALVPLLSAAHRSTVLSGSTPAPAVAPPRP